MATVWTLPKVREVVGVLAMSEGDDDLGWLLRDDEREWPEPYRSRLIATRRRAAHWQGRWEVALGEFEAYQREREHGCTTYDDTPHVVRLLDARHDPVHKAERNVRAGRGVKSRTVGG